MFQFRNLMFFSKSMKVQCRKLPAVPSHGSPHPCLPNIYTIHSHPYRPESNLCPILRYSLLPAPIALKMQGQLQTIRHLRKIKFLPNLLKLQFIRLNSLPNLDQSSHLKWLLQSIEAPHFLHIRLFGDEANILWWLLSMDYFFFIGFEKQLSTVQMFLSPNGWHIENTITSRMPLWAPLVTPR